MREDYKEELSAVSYQPSGIQPLQLRKAGSPSGGGSALAALRKSHKQGNSPL